MQGGGADHVQSVEAENRSKGPLVASSAEGVLPAGAVADDPPLFFAGMDTSRQQRRSIRVPLGRRRKFAEYLDKWLPRHARGLL